MALSSIHRVFTLPLSAPASHLAQPDPEIARLTCGLAAADEEAFREFHALYFERLYRFLLVVCRGSDDQAEEALQLTLLRVVRHARVFFQSEETFWCWLKVLARSAARDAGRKQRRYLVLLERFARWWECRNNAAADEERLTGQIETLLASLNPVERYLIEGKYLVDEPVKELASQTGLTEKAVEARLSRLRQRLRERFLHSLTPDEPS